MPVEGVESDTAEALCAEKVKMNEGKVKHVDSAAHRPDSPKGENVADYFFDTACSEIRSV